MTNLNCSASSCTHNSNSCCCNSSISVSGANADKSKSTCCSSFQEANGAFTNTAQSPNPSLDISCDAQNCMHNCDCKCEASSVDIAGASACNCEETKCSSFCCKG